MELQKKFDLLGQGLIMTKDLWHELLINLHLEPENFEELIDGMDLSDEQVEILRKNYSRIQKVRETGIDKSDYPTVPAMVYDMIDFVFDGTDQDEEKEMNPICSEIDNLLDGINEISQLSTHGIKDPAEVSRILDQKGFLTTL